MPLNADFHVVGACGGRPRGLRRLVLDFLCRHTGHLLWRTGGRMANPKGSLDLNTCHCRRCYVWGYVEGDYAKPLGVKPR